MKKIALISFVAMFFLSSFIFTADLTVQAAGAATINIESPVQGMTYNSGSVSLKYSAQGEFPSFRAGEPIISIYVDSILYDTTEKFADELVVEGLANGEHTVEVTVGEYWDCHATYKIAFFVNNGVLPEVSLFILQNPKTRDATVNITTDSQDSKVSYSLDNQQNITLPKSQLTQYLFFHQYIVQFLNLTEGTHTLKAYSSDAMNNTGISEKTFSIIAGAKETSPNQIDAATPIS
jgi:hypothetical protein